MGLVDVGAPSQEQPDYREVSFLAGRGESRAPIRSRSINRRSSIEQKLGYSFVAAHTREDERGVSSIRCGVYNGSTRDQQLYDGRVTLLRRHMQGSAAIFARVMNRRSSVEQTLSYSFVAPHTREDERGVSSIPCGVDNDSTRDQQLHDGPVTL